MTFVPRDEWEPLAELLDKPLGRRVKYVRENLARVEDPERRKLSQDAFAEAVGARSGRHRVIGWEKRGEEPRDYADAIASLTPYPPAAFRKMPGNDVTHEDLALRLQALEELTALGIDETRQGFALVRKIAQQLLNARSPHEEGEPPSEGSVS